MIRLAFLKSRWNHLGGAEKYSAKLAEAFAARGCEVTVLTTGEVEADTQLPYRVVSLHKNHRWNLRQLLSFDSHCKKWLEENPQQIVFGMDRNRFQTHYRAGNGVHAAYLSRRTVGAPFWKYWLLQANPFHRQLLKIEREAFESNHLTHLFANSNMVKKEIATYYPKATDKVSVIHNGVEWHQMQDTFDHWQEGRVEVLENLSLPKDKVHLLFVGQGYRRKGLPLVLEGMLKWKNHFHLTVIGKDREERYFKKWVESHGINESVTFLGSQNNVSSYYQMADVVVLPSIYDPFANVTVEALAMGCHLITSCGNGGCEVVTSENGTVLKELSVKAMEEALERVINLKKSEDRAQAIRDSVQHLDFSLQLERIVDATLGV